MIHIVVVVKKREEEKRKRHTWHTEFRDSHVEAEAERGEARREAKIARKIGVPFFSFPSSRLR